MTNQGQTQTRPEDASRTQALIAAFSLAAIGIHLLLRFGVGNSVVFQGIPLAQFPLLATFLFGGIPLVFDLLRKLLQGEFGSDLLAGISIVTSVLLGE